MKKAIILFLTITFTWASSAEITCSSVEECGEIAEHAQERIEQIEEAQAVEAALLEDQDRIDSLKVSRMGPFAKDADGKLLMMTYSEARAYCASRGLRLPSALEFALVSKLSNAEISFLDRNDERYSDSRDFNRIFGREVPNWVIDNMIFNWQGAEQSNFYYHIPSDFDQQISAYEGAKFWSSTMAQRREVYVYHGDRGILYSEAFIAPPGRFDHKKNAVVCAQTRN